MLRRSSGGVSLNDVLLLGSDLLRSLTGILANFRKSPVAFGGDIREMFHQVRIRPEDTTCQRFLWRNGNSKNPPDTFEMEVMIFGAVSSPCSAQFVKNKNGAEFHGQDDMPAATRAIDESHYMDDYLDSANSEQEAIARIHQVINFHSRGGFEMRNWIASSRRVLAAIPAHLRARGEFDLSSSNDLPIECTLGLRWDPNADVFLFRLSSKGRTIETGVYSSPGAQGSRHGESARSSNLGGADGQHQENSVLERFPDGSLFDTNGHI